MPKKKTALTIEERLQQALVPAEEQPYEVPENWVWVRLESVASWGSGGTPSRKHEEYYNGDILWIKTGELNNGWIYDTEEKITDEGLKKSSAKLFPPYSVLIAMYGATIGKVAILGVPATTNQACACAVCNQSLLYMYLFHYCISQKNVFIEKGKGGAQPNISQIILKQHPIPLPPLSEQQRIVERIEELFAKLDEAKERLQEVADSFAVRKAAILHKAFTGELTKKHEIEDSIVIRDKLFAERENMVQEKVLKRVKIKPLIQDEYKSQLAKNWVQCKLGEVAFVTKLAGFEYTKYIHLEDTGEIPVVRAQNVRKGYLDTTNLLYISKSVSDALSRSALKEKSVLITFIGAGIGDACVFDENQQYHLAPNVAKVEPFNKSEEKLNVYFLLYYLLSSFGQYEIFKNMKATAQPSLSMETIREIIIPLPSIEEQHEIVRLIDDLLARERAAQQAAEQALASIDLMKKSILARAFRGELGTNKASEASALELLRQVLAEG